MKVSRNYDYYEDEKLYSTGDYELDELLERAFCEGYEYAQREFIGADEIKQFRINEAKDGKFISNKEAYENLKKWRDATSNKPGMPYLKRWQMGKDYDKSSFKGKTLTANRPKYGYDPFYSYLLERPQSLYDKSNAIVENHITNKQLNEKAHLNNRQWKKILYNKSLEYERKKLKAVKAKLDKNLSKVIGHRI